MRIQQQLNVYDGKALSGSVVRANNYYLAGNGERASERAHTVLYTHIAHVTDDGAFGEIGDDAWLTTFFVTLLFGFARSRQHNAQ